MRAKTHILIAVVLGIVIAAGPAWAVTYTMPITFTNDVRLNSLANFPALVVLATNKVDYSQFLPNAQDLRFSDTNGVELSYEVESWNTASNSYIWVKVPAMSASGVITASWGNASAPLPAYRTNGLAWDSSFKAVWHLKEDVGGTGTVNLYKDSTTNSNHGSDYVSATGKGGAVGAGQQFDGSDDYIVAPAGITRNAMTLSFWVNQTALKDSLVFMDRAVFNGTGGIEVYVNSSGQLRVAGDGSGGSVTANSTNALNTWVYETVIYSGTNASIYKNGTADGSGVVAQVVASAHTSSIGRYGDGLAGLYWNGSMDEMRISGVVRSPDWIWAEYATMAQPGAFAACGAVQQGSEFSVTVTSPTAGQLFQQGAAITATVVVANGSLPYQTVTFYTNSSSAWSTNNTSTNRFTIVLGTPGIGVYTNYAAVLDATNGVATSLTNTFTVLAAPPTHFSWISSVNGSWSSAANWSNETAISLAPAAAGQADYTLSFNQTGTYNAVHDLNNGFLFNQLNLGGAQVTLSGNSLAFTNNGATFPQINQNSSNAVTINNACVLGATMTCGGAGSGVVTLAGALSGAGRLIKEGTGQLTLSGANTCTGGATVNGGVLYLANSALPAGTITNNGTLTQYRSDNGNNLITTNTAGAGTWVVDGSGGGASYENRVVFFTAEGASSSASGPILVQGNGKLWFVTRAGQNPTWGAVQTVSLLTAGSTMSVFGNAGQTVAIGSLQGIGTVNLPDTSEGDKITLSIGSDNSDQTFGGVIRNVIVGVGSNPILSLTKVGAGTQVLSGANTYSGATTISNGTLRVNGSLSATGAVMVVSGGTLGGTGTVGSVTNNGTLAPGSGSVMGTLTASNLVLSAGCTNAFDLGATTASDQVVVNGTLTLNGGVITVASQTGFGNGTYTLFSYGTTSNSTLPTVEKLPGYAMTLVNDETARKVLLSVSRSGGTLLLVQ